MLTEKKIEQVAFRCSDTLKDWLTRYAEAHGISLSELLNTICAWYLCMQEGLGKTLSDKRMLEMELAREKLHLALADGVLTNAEKIEIQPHLSAVENGMWNEEAA